MAWSAPRLIPRRLATIAEAPWFQRGVIAAIVANAVLLGIETSPNAAPWAKSAFTGPHLALSSLFVAEIGIRLGATWPTPRRFFRDPWNRFDVVVVALSLLPQAGPLALVARLARLLRLARMFSVGPELRLLIGTMFRSIGSLGHIALLLGVILYGPAPPTDPTPTLAAATHETVESSP